MIQRIQSLWLLAAGICGFTALKLPFYIGSKGNVPAEDFTAVSSIYLMILAVAIAVVALINIFLYKNRGLQLKLGLAGFAGSILYLVLAFSKIRQYDTGGIALTAVFSFAIPVFYLLAIRGIYKDEKLVKSTDRLR